MSPRDARVLRAGCGIVAGLFAIASGAPYVRDAVAVRVADATSTRDRLAFAESAASSRSAIRDTLGARQRRLTLIDSALVRGGSPVAAAVDLTDIVSELAESADVLITTIQIRADSISRGPFSVVGVRVGGTTGAAGLAEFLRAIEEDDGGLAVREFSVSQPDPTGAPGQPEALHIDMVIEALARMSPGGLP